MIQHEDLTAYTDNCEYIYMQNEFVQQATKEICFYYNANEVP